MSESDEKRRWIKRTLKLVAKLRPIAQGEVPGIVVLTSSEAAALIIALATTYVVAEGEALMTGKGGALLSATLDQWAKPPESVS